MSLNTTYEYKNSFSDLILQVKSKLKVNKFNFFTKYLLYIIYKYINFNKSSNTGIYNISHTSNM